MPRVHSQVGNVAITLISAGLMDACGRKPLLLGSAAGMVFASLALTAALTHPGQPWTSPLAVVSVVGFVTSFGIGMGPVRGWDGMGWDRGRDGAGAWLGWDGIGIGIGIGMGPVRGRCPRDRLAPFAP